jgi:hypothetical protein
MLPVWAPIRRYKISVNVTSAWCSSFFASQIVYDIVPVNGFSISKRKSALLSYVFD